MRYVSYFILSIAYKNKKEALYDLYIQYLMISSNEIYIRNKLIYNRVYDIWKEVANFMNQILNISIDYIIHSVNNKKWYTSEKK